MKTQIPILEPPIRKGDLFSICTEYIDNKVCIFFSREGKDYLPANLHNNLTHEKHLFFLRDEIECWNESKHQSLYFIIKTVYQERKIDFEVFPNKNVLMDTSTKRTEFLIKILTKAC